jgi:predicted DNA-binding transcriptional regulator AlpA
MATELQGGETGRRLLKLKQGAEYLGISERKLWGLASAGKVRTVRLDRALRFDVHDLDELIAQSKQ